ncbi:hypothetical protein BMS3Bbin07_00151 [bacterium BMS3Bbin07]|nr:hypothetical protein BMS3Bbin07_00151 [bacterium BMS3Bbin07]
MSIVKIDLVGEFLKVGIYKLLHPVVLFPGVNNHAFHIMTHKVAYTPEDEVQITVKEDWGRDLLFFVLNVFPQEQQELKVF